MSCQFLVLVGPILMQQNLDRSVFDSGSSAAHKAQFKTPEPAAAHPATPDPSHSPAPGNASSSLSSTSTSLSQSGIEENKGV